jgi:hypothetical protein
MHPHHLDGEVIKENIISIMEIMSERFYKLKLKNLRKCSQQLLKYELLPI